MDEERDRGSIMKSWSLSAMDQYYFDPEIQFLSAIKREGAKREGAKSKGYFIVPHCDPDCCAAFGGIATSKLGPFKTRIKARDWSRNNMVSPGDNLH